MTLVDQPTTECGNWYCLFHANQTTGACTWIKMLTPVSIAIIDKQTW